MLTAIKLKNRISKVNQASEMPIVIEYVNLKNYKVNGETKGCTGFIKNPANGVVVYVYTEPCPCIIGGEELMFRYARDIKDYRGMMNRWCEEENYAEAVYKALLNVEKYDREKTHHW